MPSVLERFSEMERGERQELDGVTRGDTLVRDGDTYTVLGCYYVNGGEKPDLKDVRYHNTYNDGHSHRVTVSTWKKWAAEFAEGTKR